MINTPYIDDPDGYAFSNIQLTDGRDVGDVLEIFRQIHFQFSQRYNDIDYNLSQNSNSYAPTLLSIFGINVFHYLAGATPNDARNGFPRAAQPYFESKRDSHLGSDVIHNPYC